MTGSVGSEGRSVVTLLPSFRDKINWG